MLRCDWLTTALVSALAGAAFGGCTASKSANPLTPTVAGPIPGVDITAPRAVTPTAGFRIAADEQPVTLTVENASSNGQRSLNYGFELASDAGFTNPLYARDGITAGDGSTSLRLADALAADRTYYWRARAQDGANAGPYSETAMFAVFTPVVLGAPTPIGPAPNATTPTLRPTFVFNNAARSGSAGPITYVVELSLTDSFATRVSGTVPEQPNQTSLQSPQDLPAGSYIFWRVRATDPTTAGPWSPTLAFSTPAVPQPTPGPPPVDGVPPDAVDLQQAHVYNSPYDVALWPATSRLTRLSLMPSGAHVESTQQSAWPDVWPPGWNGPLLYTLWIVVRINGQWYTSGCIEYWRGLYQNGGPVTEYGQNWYYDPGRWGAMAGYQPAPGEQVGFFITAGDARNNGVSIVHERSNVVLVPFPSSGGGSFTY